MQVEAEVLQVRCSGWLCNVLQGGACGTWRADDEREAVLDACLDGLHLRRQVQCTFTFALHPFLEPLLCTTLQVCATGLHMSHAALPQLQGEFCSDCI
jgi:hypothetical protein